MAYKTTMSFSLKNHLSFGLRFPTLRKNLKNGLLRHATEFKLNLKPFFKPKIFQLNCHPGTRSTRHRRPTTGWRFPAVAEVKCPGRSRCTTRRTRRSKSCPRWRRRRTRAVILRWCSLLDCCVGQSHTAGRYVMSRFIPQLHTCRIDIYRS